ncbi:MAG TPA: response regulator transcription factor [Segetibacter sp.]|jgi:DNA-binding LytR/AlgR family response regulator
MSYKVVIVDDEPLAIEVLAYYLKDEPGFAVAASFTNPVEALAYLSTHEFDLLFLDINMAVLNGLDLVKQLKKEPLIVFTTAHKQYLQDGFDYGILDYLQKPIKKDRFTQTLSRAEKELNKAPAPGINNRQIHIKTSQKEFYLNVDNILFIKAVKDYCLLFLDDNTKILALGTLKTFIEKHELNNTFIRTHKSYLVPVNRLKEIQAGGIISIGTHKVPIGRKYKEDVFSMFNKSEQ